MIKNFVDKLTNKKEKERRKKELKEAEDKKLAEIDKALREATLNTLTEEERVEWEKRTAAKAESKKVTNNNYSSAPVEEKPIRYGSITSETSVFWDKSGADVGINRGHMGDGIAGSFCGMTREP